MKIKKRLCLAISFILVIAISSVAFAARTTLTPNGNVVVHDSEKNGYGFYVEGHSWTNVYLAEDPSQTKYHYSRVQLKLNGIIIADSDREWGYNTVHAYSGQVENSSDITLKSYWGGVY